MEDTTNQVRAIPVNEDASVQAGKGAAEEVSVVADAPDAPDAPDAADAAFTAEAAAAMEARGDRIIQKVSETMGEAAKAAKVIKNDFNPKKIIGMLGNWFAADPLINFAVELTLTEKLVLFFAPAVFAAISLTLSFGKLIGFAAAFFIGLVIPLVYQLLVGASLLVINNIYKIHLAQEKESVFNLTAVAASLLCVSFLLGLILGLFSSMLSAVVILLGFNIYWLALYTGLRKVSGAVGRSPLIGFALARVIIAYLTVILPIQLLIRTLLSSLFGSFSNAMGLMGGLIR